MLKLRLQGLLRNGAINEITSIVGLQSNSKQVTFYSSSTSPHLVNSPYGNIDIPNVTIPQFVWKDVSKWPDLTAITCGITGRSYSYGQLRGMSAQFGASLLKAGLKPGDVIAIILPNIPEYPAIFLGTLEAGMVVSTINPIYNAEEIGYQLMNSGSKCVVTFGLKMGEVSEAMEIIKKKGQQPPKVVMVGNYDGGSSDGLILFKDMVTPGAAPTDLLKSVKSSAQDLAVMPYSSGTTGLPKGVRLSHHNIVSNLAQINSSEAQFALETTSSYQEVAPCVLPFFHIYGLTVGLLSYLGNGCKLVALPRFEPESFLHALKDHKATLVHVVPPLVQFLAHHPTVKPEHIAHLRAAINGAASVSTFDAQKLMEKKKDLKVVSGYGLTESSPVITAAPRYCTNLQTVGLIMPSSQIKIINTDSGEIQDPSKPGEICVRGPHVMQGYHNNEEANRSTLIDGWLHTGDVGYFDSDNYLYIVDRIKELIKVKGFQVAPLELEEILRTHPAVGDAGVVGKPDKRCGEVPVAFVVLNPGAKATEKDLQDYVASKVSEYKQLDSVIFTTAIPKNTTGKILRRKLRETLEQRS